MTTHEDAIDNHHGTANAPRPLHAGWQPLPTRARPPVLIGTALAFAIPATIAATVLGAVFARWLPAPPWAMAAIVFVLAAAFGAWLGNKRFRYTRWLLDGDGFALQRGRLWQTETRVPGSRVQHLDIKRGPLQRWLRLATLQIHTAGSRHSVVSLAGLDEGEAERLRDALARQTDDDDDG